VTVTETQQAEVGGNPVERIYEGTPALNAALAAVQSQLPRIDKGKTAKVPMKAGGTYTYTYADLADVSALVLPLLGDNGLSFTCWPTLVGNRFVLRYELLHQSGQSKGGEYPLPIDAGAQALGSAITYARRYTLCAVTGVAPDDDDDAAAAEGIKQAERDEERAELGRELKHAVDSVRGAWAQQYGEFDQDQAAELFKTWSRGGSLKNAPAGQLRAFAGYLNALPPADAGSTPDSEQEPPVEGEAPQEAKADRPMSPRQRGMLFALFGELGIDGAAEQRELIGRIVEHPIESRGDLTTSEAKLVIDTLQAGVPAPAGDRGE
jgi:hypothetical protein